MLRLLRRLRLGRVLRGKPPALSPEQPTELVVVRDRQENIVVAVNAPPR